MFYPIRGEKMYEIKIWNYLLEHIGNPYGVAGMMGNLYAESGLNPKNLQNSFETKLKYTDDSYTAAVDNGEYTGFIFDNAGYGMAQWTYWSRKSRLLSIARERGTSIGDVDTQLECLWSELETNKAILSSLRAAKSVREASDIVLEKYERPKDQSEAVHLKRSAYSQKYYDMFVGGETMPTANELRIKVRDKYRTILGRNYYSQARRKYCYQKYSNGKYYSDCSSSISLTYKEVGLSFGLMNTVDMISSDKLETVPVIIKKGQIMNPEILRIGDMLLFAGTDSSRKKYDYVGHVEMVGEINGSTIILYGHGSDKPSKKNMKTYCSRRYNSKTNKTPIGNKGLIRVRRFIRDDMEAPKDYHIGDRTLRRGDKGDDVRQLQEMLMTLGWSFPQYGADGDYGAETEANVKGFQRVSGLPVNGIFDHATYEALTSKLNGSKLKITGSAVNVRSGPGTNNSVIGVAHRGDTFDYGLEANGWYQIDYNGSEGWVSGKYSEVQ